MRAYNIQKLLFHLNTRPEVAARYGTDRDALFDDYRIADDERRLLETGDVGALYAMGAHPLLLAPFGARHCGLAWPDYLRAMGNPGPTIAAGDRR